VSTESVNPNPEHPDHVGPSSTVDPDAPRTVSDDTVDDDELIEFEATAPKPGQQAAAPDDEADVD
jgi:hypothetical protein